MVLSWDVRQPPFPSHLKPGTKCTCGRGCVAALESSSDFRRVGGGYQGVSNIGFLTPPKFNMEPENDGFQRESPFPGTSFQVPC